MRQRGRGCPHEGMQSVRVNTGGVFTPPCRATPVRRFLTLHPDVARTLRRPSGHSPETCRQGRREDPRVNERTNLTTPSWNDLAQGGWGRFQPMKIPMIRMTRVDTAFSRSRANASRNRMPRQSNHIPKYLTAEAQRIRMKHGLATTRSLVFLCVSARLRIGPRHLG